MDFVEHLRKILKPAIHYSQTGRTGDKIIFSPNKILAKTRQTCCCTLFVVRHQRGRRFFLTKKILCVRWRDCYPNANLAYSIRQKTCLRNMANAFYTLFAVLRFFVISSLFRCYLRIVYSGQDDFFFDKKILCVSRRDHYQDANPAYLQCTAKNLFPKHGERLLYTIRHTSFFCRFVPISLLFANSV